ncbi:hypothetical protein EW146_g3211 [Bondarzewia mesenterica]|uniref:Uncharacterized protein n=1 Tax=Bondarzewia mesenterica TaxID=1095465 RepID=A0A4S4LYI6_9AGAM|nr:hypothetical protein EW146_g3211 [Bondarzewia mesenterica]
MPAHPILIAKLKEVFSDHMKLLPGALADLEDYVVWGKIFIEYLNHLETLNGFMPDTDVDKWVKECECKVAAKYEKAWAQEEQAIAVKAKEEAQITHRKVHEVEKLALLIADKILLDNFEHNSDDD